MIPVRVDYACESQLLQRGGGYELVLCANRRRRVRMRARVCAHGRQLRLGLLALGEVLWSDQTARAQATAPSANLDPVVTVRADGAVFEAFAPDGSCAARVVASRACLAIEQPAEIGTTTVRFPPCLLSALEALRSRHQLFVRVELEPSSDGLDPCSPGWSGELNLSDEWAREVARLQARLPMLRTRLRVRPVDMLAVVDQVRRLADCGPPRALRFELRPGGQVTAVVEPWEPGVVLRHAVVRGGSTQTVRTWGRDRLRILEPLLPFARHVDVRVGEDGQPSVYTVRMAGVSFVMCLAGWTGSDPKPPGWHAVRESVGVTAEWVASVHASLVRARALTLERAAASARVERHVAARALRRLCRAGRAMYDVERGLFLHRELLEAPLDDKRLFEADPLWESAAAWVADKRLATWQTEDRQKREWRRVRGPGGPVACEVVRREREVVGVTNDGLAVRVRCDDEGRLVSGRCACDFFRENLMSRGPCVHMLALLVASERRD